MTVQHRKLNGRFQVQDRRLSVQPTIQADDASWPIPEA
jgi:hypothetical protein